MPYEISVYQSESGEAPFQDWVEGLKDPKAQTIIATRIERAAAGLFGDWKAIAGANGLCEMRIHFGPGYRIYYSIIGQQIVLLLAGSTKQTQDKIIATAKTCLADHNRRTKP
jgi:putative addiction module killer protein